MRIPLYILKMWVLLLNVSLLLVWILHSLIIWNPISGKCLLHYNTLHLLWLRLRIILPVNLNIIYGCLIGLFSAAQRVFFVVLVLRRFLIYRATSVAYWKGIMSIWKHWLKIGIMILNNSYSPPKFGLKLSYLLFAFIVNVARVD